MAEPEHAELSALIDAALQDASIHTDARMALRRQLIEVVEDGRHHAAGTGGGGPPADDGALSKLVADAASDPDLHTDARMALARKVRELVSVAHESPRG